MFEGGCKQTANFSVCLEIYIGFFLHRLDSIAYRMVIVYIIKFLFLLCIHSISFSIILAAALTYNFSQLDK